MKKLKLLLSLIIVGLASYMLFADSTGSGNIGHNEQIVNESALSVAKTAVIDTNENEMSRISAQVTASSSTVASVTFYDGKVSTMQISIISNVALSSAVANATITVASFTALSSAAANNLIVIASHSALSGTYAYNIIIVTDNVTSLAYSTITFDDYSYREGIEWNVQADSATTAICISTTLTNSLILATTFWTPTQVGVYLQAKDKGSSANSYDLNSSTPNGFIVSYSSFIHGFDNASFTLYGTTYTQGKDWFKLAYASWTAINISTQISNPLFSLSVVNSTGIYIKSVAKGSVGNSYTITTSTVALLRKSATFGGGVNQAGAFFTIRGSTFSEGEEWGMEATSSETATSIAFAIQKTSITFGVKAEAIGSVVYTTPIAVVVSSNGIKSTQDLWGRIPNSWFLTVSTPALLSSGTFTGGQDRAILGLGKLSLINGLNWKSNSTVSTSFSSITVKNISDAIMANSTISAIIISSYNPGGYALNTITITSMSALVNSTITVNGTKLREGIEWHVLGSSMTTTVAISTIIATISNIYITSAGVNGLDVINLRVNLLDPVGNTYGLSSSTSTAMVISNSSFTGGLYPTLYTTSTFVNSPWAIVTSTQGALQLSSASYIDEKGSAYGFMKGGFSADISTITGLITKSNTFSNGFAVLLTTTTSGITGLIEKTTYYVKSPTKDNFYLSRTSTGAVAVTTSTILNVGTFNVSNSTGGGTYTLSSLIMTGISSITWQGSNDNVNWNVVGVGIGVSSTTTSGLTTFWDFGNFDYKWLKINISSPTVIGNGIDVKAWVNGKK